MGAISVVMGTQAAAHQTSEVSSRVPGSTQEYLHPLGTRGMDDLGNQYIYCEYGAQVYTGVWVGITSDYAACAILTATFRGPIGIAMGAGASDTAGWVQVYGTFAAAQIASGDSAATSSYNMIVASSVSTPAVGADATALVPTSDEGHFIDGAWVTGAASSATSSATSQVGVTVPVRLNYPSVVGHVRHHST